MNLFFLKILKKKKIHHVSWLRVTGKDLSAIQLQRRTLHIKFCYCKHMHGSLLGY